MNAFAFDKLSLVAQYDDMCRLVNKLIKDSADEEDACIAMLEGLQKRWNNREISHEKEKDKLMGEIVSLQKEIKKLSRQLTESRSALVREAEDKKAVAREKKALLDQIRQVRQLVEKESYGDTDAHRKRVIKCLDVDRLSPIQSDDSDDCVSGLDYDRTEEDILDTDHHHRSPRKSSAFDDALESLQPNEQPTLLLNRYNMGMDKNQDGHNHLLDNLRDQPRRSTRLASNRRSRHESSEQSNAPTSASSSNHLNKFADSNPETDSNSLETDDQDIEYVRQQLQKYEADKREKLASSNSTPNIKDMKKSATLSAKSTASLMKTVSNVGTPVANALKPHSFVTKKTLMPNDSCVSCGTKVKFYTLSFKCQVCNITCHPECKDNAPLPCVKITAPNTRSKQRKILISDYVSNDAVPKVPAIIVHCCNEIEKDENIDTPALYQAIASTKDIEELQQKILKSKSGMPNLSKVEVHLLTGVVKRFLQSLDESLITTTLWNYFAEAIKLSSDLDAKTHMSYYIENDLPTANRDTLSFLMQHLHLVASHSDKNLMDTKKLAKVFAPTIVGNSTRNPEQSKVPHESKIQVQIMETLFGIDEKFWAGFVQKVPPTPRSASFGSRLLTATPKGKESRSKDSRFGATLQTPRLKPLFMP
uniref:Rac GTPase-activating protein 1 n=1 Tax=Aceria tosichella TaxID=561515 RepID=A0A6G1S8E1_9ACAR